jgi:phage shock protein PspC (stress-responsive transcriptional regulator)
MAISGFRVRRVARYFDVDPLAVRVYAGVLVLLPILTIALAELFDSIAAAFVVAGVISVTLIALFPHDRSEERARVRKW